MRYSRFIIAAVAASLLAACATNGGSFTPSVTQTNLGSDKLQFAVGTANIGFDDATGLNVVATLRQPNGLSAVLLDTPTITGPEGFVVPDYIANSVDNGTDHISGSPQVAPGVNPVVSTFGIYGGLFSYGVAPDNSTETAGASYGLYYEPFFSGSGGAPFEGGPPAYPFFNDGSYPSGFTGYTQGFNAFEGTGIVAGQYSLAANVPIANAPSVNFSGNATLTDTTLLPEPSASLVEDGNGGGTAEVTVGDDPRVVETMIYIVDVDYDGTNNKFEYYSVGPLDGTGDLEGPLPDALGPCTPVGCENTAKAQPTIVEGDDYIVYAVTYDYPAFEAGPPGNKSETPTITEAASDNQADIAISGINEFEYGDDDGAIHIHSLRSIFKKP